MATYLPGVTDYIPNIQEYKPDYNFYQNALQTKENQYKSGYDKISNVYGTLLNSEMLREPDIKKRDKFFRDIENEIQRMSSVDLSLSENVNSAYKVFQPLIDDKNITKDIAFTKSYRTQKQRAETSRMAADGQWWDVGDRALDYMADEFSKADDPTAQSMSNPRYTPYTDVVKNGMGMIKKMGINVQSVSWDKSGKYIVTTKNGSQVTIPLYSLLYSGMGNDPAVADVFRTQAYVQRKDYVKENAAAYNGDETQAELAYLNQHREEADKLNQILQGQTDDTLKELGINKQMIENQIKKQGALPSSNKKSILQTIADQQAATEDTKAHVEAGLALTNPNEITNADIKVLRSRVDGAVANIELSKSMMGIARTWSALNSVESVEKDPYAFSSFEHTLALDSMKKKYLIDSQLKAEQYGYDKNLKAMDAFMKSEKQKANALYGNTDNNIWKATGIGNTDSNAKLSDVNLETQGKVTKNVTDRKIQYLQETYKLYDGLRKSDDPASQAKGAMVMKSIFGDTDTPISSLLTTSGPNSYISMYEKAVKANSGNAPLLAGSDVMRFNDMKKGVDEYQMIQNGMMKQATANNKIALTYLKTLEQDEDSPDADLFIDSKGHTATESQFTQSYIQKYGTDDGATSRYKGLTDHWVKVLDANVPGIKSYNSAFTNASGAGTIYAENISIGIDSADPSSEGYRTMLSVRDDIFKPTTAISNPAAKPVVEEFFRDFANNEYDNKNDKRPSGTLTYMGIINGDRNQIGYSVKMDHDWLEANKGTDKNHGSTWDLFVNGKWNDTAVFTLPKSTAKSSIAKASDVTPTDYMLGLGPIVVDQYSEWGGKRTIEKNEDGGYTITGTMRYFDEAKRDWAEFPKVDYVPKGVPAEAVLNSIKFVLRDNAIKQLAAEQKAAAEHGTKDPNKLLQQQ